MKFLGLIDKIARIIGLTIFSCIVILFISYFIFFASLFASGNLKDILSGIIEIIKPFRNTGLYLLVILFLSLFVVVFAGNLYRQKIEQNKKDNLQ